MFPLENSFIRNMRYASCLDTRCCFYEIRVFPVSLINYDSSIQRKKKKKNRHRDIKLMKEGSETTFYRLIFPNFFFWIDESMNLQFVSQNLNFRTIQDQVFIQSFRQLGVNSVNLASIASTWHQ